MIVEPYIQMLNCTHTNAVVVVEFKNKMKREGHVIYGTVTSRDISKFTGWYCPECGAKG